MRPLQHDGRIIGLSRLAGPGVALYMHADAVVEGFLLFMQQEPDSYVSNKFDTAFTALERYDEALDDIRAEVAQATRAAAQATRAAKATATPRAD